MCFFIKKIFSIFRIFFSILDYTRIFICNIFLLSIIILIIFSYIIFNKHNNTYTPLKGALLCDFGEKILDKPILKNNKLNKIEKKILGISNNIEKTSLFEIVNKLKQAKTDKKITGIILSLDNLIYADQSSLEYIGKYLKDFKKSNKPIYSIGRNYNQLQYFLASYANKVYLYKNGSVELNGISNNRFYYKSFLDKLKINSHVFRIGKYKSAVEPFIRNNMSSESKNENKQIFKYLWNKYLTIVSSNRNMNINNFFPKISLFIKKFYESNGKNDFFALKNKWIDKITSYYNFKKDMINIFGINKNKKTFNYINYKDYKIYKRCKQKKNIAVICINGTILNNYKNNDNIVNVKEVIRQIKFAKSNPSIKSIILRINSPGGSVEDSEAIEEEIQKFKNSGKPVIVSMGEVAASGGYWISAPANYIFASDNTITGSIGIFSVINTFENTLKSLGIHSDGYSTFPLSNIFYTKNLSKYFSKIIEISLQSKYNQFIELISKYRHKNPKEIKKIAAGKIWTGKDAVKNGLVDEIGDFDDAVKKAAKLCNLNKYNVIWFYNKYNLLNKLIYKTSFLNKKIFLKYLINIIYNKNVYNVSETFLIDYLSSNQYKKYSICIL